jgi:putative transposase
MADDLLFRKRYRIPSARYPGWDYRWAGVYSVTVCTLDRMRCLSTIVEGEVSLSPLGEIVAEEWLAIPHHHPRVHLDEWILMPDHMHGILIFHGKTPADGRKDSSGQRSESLGAVIGRFKSDATKQVRWRLRRTDFAWQPRFHDVILHKPADLARVRAYIRDNPKRWQP